MITSNINKYVRKCYLNVFKIVPVEMESSQPLVALAMLLKNDLSGV